MTEHEGSLKEAEGLLRKSKNSGALESQQALDQAVEKLEDTGHVEDDPGVQARQAEILLEISGRFQTDASTLYAAAKPARLAIECAKRSLNTTLIVKSLLDRGRISNLAHCAGDALDSLCEALELASSEDIDPELLVALWSEVGNAWFVLEEPLDAHPCYERAAQVAEGAGLPAACCCHARCQ